MLVDSAQGIDDTKCVTKTAKRVVTSEEISQWLKRVYAYELCLWAKDKGGCKWKDIKLPGFRLKSNFNVDEEIKKSDQLCNRWKYIITKADLFVKFFL